MHCVLFYLLLVIERPVTAEQRDLRAEERYNRCIGAVADLSSKNTSIQALGENVLLLPIDHALEPLARVLQVLNQVNYKYVTFAEELKWHATVKIK